jgi:hypothetical protein
MQATGNPRLTAPEREDHRDQNQRPAVWVWLRHFHAGRWVDPDLQPGQPLPGSVRREHAPALGLAITQPPLPLRSFPISALVHSRNTADGAVLWALSVLQSVAENPEKAADLP